ncbi:MAG: S41 family peptidase [Lachnospiraceae bacterium]|nr:S41 family peptidase [Lachnospiraceae bacterium]
MTELKEETSVLSEVPVPSEAPITSETPITSEAPAISETPVDNATDNPAEPAADQTFSENGAASGASVVSATGKRKCCGGLKRVLLPLLAGVIIGALVASLMFMFLGGDPKEKLIRRLIHTTAVTDAPDAALNEGKYKGMVAALEDPYAGYFTAEETTDNTDKRSGTYEGLGIILVGEVDGSFVVGGVYPDSPAEKAGVMAGDIVEMVGDTSVHNDTYVDDENADEGWTLTEVLTLIAEMGDNVVLTVKRGEETLTFAITPGEVVVPRVFSSMTEDGIGFIRIEKFNKLTAEQFGEALTELKEQGLKGLIIDLRDNTGGLVDITRECLNHILPEGLMVYTQTKDGTRKDYVCEGTAPLEVPLAILVNGRTASSSEIFAGACRDRLGAVLVGQPTFGKGIIQTTVKLDDGSSVKLTTAHYYTPNGDDINGVGLEPDYPVEIEVPEGTDTIEAMSEEDTQYQEALRLVREQAGLS